MEPRGERGGQAAARCWRARLRSPFLRRLAQRSAPGLTCARRPSSSPHTLPPAPSPQVYNSPAIPAEVLQECGAGMGRVSAVFDQYLRTFLTLLPAQSHLDLRFFLSRMEQVGGGEGGGGAPGAAGRLD